MPVNRAYPDSDRSKSNTATASTFISICSLVVSIVSLGFACINLKDRKAQDIKILGIQNEQLALQKNQQDLANRAERRSRATVHPRQNQAVFTIVDKKVDIPTIELVNSSDRTIVELEVDWEFIGTDFGYVEGWNGFSKAKLDSQLLQTGESVECSKGFPEDKIAFILGQRKNMEAKKFFGYLIVRYRDSREDAVNTSKHRLVFTGSDSSKVMLRISEDSRFDFDEFSTTGAK